MKSGLTLNKCKEARSKQVWDFPYNIIFYSLAAIVASAIENSDVVLMCYSEKYKESANCRLEGEYTITTGVEFIPLRMQQNYKANGW